MELDLSRTAVLALHFQRDVVTKEGAFGAFFGGEVERRGVILKARRVLEKAREKGLPVIFTRVCFRPGYPDLIANDPLFSMVKQANCLVEGSPGAELVSEVGPKPGDLVVNHRRVSGFHESDLHVILVANRINTLVMFGVASNITVESTARQAVDLGYRVIILEDCCAAASQSIHDSSMESLKILCEEVANSDQFLEALGG